MYDSVSHFWATYSPIFVNVGYNILLAVVILLVCRVAARAVYKALQKTAGHFEKMDPTLLPIVCTTASYLVYVIGAVFILDIFGVNTASIIALLGAAGLAVGFALRDTLSNIAAGIMLLFLRPFNAGDSVDCAGISGTVKEINLFTTQFTTGDGLFVCVPNSSIWSSSITNYNRNGKRRVDIVVGVDYRDSMEAGLEALRKIAEAEKRFLPDPAPVVMVTALANSSVNLQLRGWTTNADYWQTLWDLNKRIKEEMETAGLSLSVPQRVVREDAAAAAVVLKEKK